MMQHHPPVSFGAARPRLLCRPCLVILCLLGGLCLLPGQAAVAGEAAKDKAKKAADPAPAEAKDAEPKEAAKEPAKEDGATEVPPKEEPPKDDGLDLKGGRGSVSEGFEPYMELLGGKYIPAQGGQGAVVEIQFNLTTEVPKGMKIVLALELGNTEVDRAEYLLKDENRKNLTCRWSPETRLTPGEYTVRSRIDLADQTPAVQKLMKANPKQYPLDKEPWFIYHLKKETDVIKVGTDEEKAADREALCTAYTTYIEKLLENMEEFKVKMAEVKEGKALVKDGVLDDEKFKACVIEWRKKQGKLQESIVMFQRKEPVLFQMSPTAHLNLLELARMVSKRAVQLQREVTDQYKRDLINPPSHQYFDPTYRRAVNADTLNKRMETINGIVCPEKVAPDEDPKEKPKAEGFDPYLELIGGKYIPAQRGQKAGVEIQFNLTTEVPKGMKIVLALELGKTEVGRTEYLLKDEDRQNLTCRWSPEEPLAPGEYTVRSRIHLADQTPAVQKLMKANAKQYPPDKEPWSIDHLKKEITVGTDEGTETPKDKPKAKPKTKTPAKPKKTT